MIVFWSAGNDWRAPGAPLHTVGDLLETCCLRDRSEGPSPPRPSQEEPGSPQTNSG
jgi:hypothetical protein